MAETNGGVIWKPRSPGVYLNFQGDGNNLKGFQFRDALSMAYGTLINTDGNGNQFNNLYFFNVSAAHYIKLNMNSKYNLIQNCNFEYKPKYGPCPSTGPTSAVCPPGQTWYSGNIIAVEPNPSFPGYHKIRYSAFYNMPDSPMGVQANTVDFGNENIRIGEDELHNFASRTIVEYCVFNSTYGDDSEAISVKSRQNVIRFNTFAQNTGAMVVLRNGDWNVVYSNFFVKAGGVRVKHANNSYIYNNYFEKSGDNVGSWPISWHNLTNWGPYYMYRNQIYVFHNTFVECGYINLDTIKKSGGWFINNIFKKTPSTNALAPAGNLFWGNSDGIGFLGNQYSGTLNSNTPYSVGTSGKKGPPYDTYCYPTSKTCDAFPTLTDAQLRNADPVLVWDPTLGYYIPNVPNASPFTVGVPVSPAVGAAVALPANAIFDIGEVDDDPYVKYDITGRLRPTVVGARDIGCFQSATTGVILNYPRNVFNTGVVYRSSIIGKPTTAPTSKPAFGPPSFVPTVAPSKPTKSPTQAPSLKTKNAEHKEGEAAKEHGSPEEAPAPIVVPPTVAVAADANEVTKEEVAKEEAKKDVEKEAKKAEKKAKKAEEEPSTIQKVASGLKAFMTKESTVPALRASKFVETAASPTKSPSSGLHKPTWKPSSKPAERRE
jgi:hypothetical protein